MKEARKVFEALIREALVRRVIAYPDELRIEHCISSGEPIPDHVLPGRLIMCCPERQRMALQELRTEDVQSYWMRP